jgi:hypothetical protein
VSAAEIAIDPTKVRVPSEDKYLRRMVSDLADAELGQQEQSDLAYVRQLVEQNGFGELGDDGLPLGPIDPKRLSDSKRIAASYVNEATVRVRAYRIEREQRAQKARECAEHDAAKARETLDRFLDRAPAALDELGRSAVEVRDAHGRVERLAIS